MAAEAIQLGVKARYGVRVLLIVVQHTFGGFLNFYPHLHILVSEGGLHESNGLWIRRLEYFKHEPELMRALRFAAIAYLAEALKGQVLTSEFCDEELRALFEAQHKRSWRIDIGRRMSKADFLRYVGRYIRRPPVAQHRLTRERASSSGAIRLGSRTEKRAAKLYRK